MHQRTRETPSWFHGVEGAHRIADLNGIDAIARITDLNGRKPIRVPIQIKSSWIGKQLYYLKHPECWVNGVLVIVIQPALEDEDIRRIAYHMLRKVMQKGIDFEPFLRRYFKWGT